MPPAAGRIPAPVAGVGFGRDGRRPAGRPVLAGHYRAHREFGGRDRRFYRHDFRLARWRGWLPAAIPPAAGLAAAGMLDGLAPHPALVAWPNGRGCRRPSRCPACRWRGALRVCRHTCNWLKRRRSRPWFRHGPCRSCIIRRPRRRTTTCNPVWKLYRPGRQSGSAGMFMPTELRPPGRPGPSRTRRWRKPRPCPPPARPILIQPMSDIGKSRTWLPRRWGWFARRGQANAGGMPVQAPAAKRCTWRI